ncbi:MAG: hemerythrin domain-containing protein, partial [Thalassospira sp.]
ELIELIALSREIEIVHGDHPDAPVGLADALMEMAEQLDMHMTKEENILFPAMREMSRNTSITSALAMPIHCMREEHDDHGQA